MDDPKKPPIVLANQAIRLLTNQLVGEEYVILPQDFVAMRVTFRRGGGKWESLVAGETAHTRLLAEIVKAWGAMPGRIKQTELG